MSEVVSSVVRSDSATEDMLVLADRVVGVEENVRAGVKEEEAVNMGIVVKIYLGIPFVWKGGG